jgi:hypothetical protein
VAALPADVALPPAAGALPSEQADELRIVAGWLADHADRLQLVVVEGELATDLPPLPSFDDPDAPAAGVADVDQADAPASGDGDGPAPDRAVAFGALRPRQGAVA